MRGGPAKHPTGPPTKAGSVRGATNNTASNPAQRGNDPKHVSREFKYNQNLS